jgi:hypothetical protein
VAVTLIRSFGIIWNNYTEITNKDTKSNGSIYLKLYKILARMYGDIGSLILLL